MFLLGVNLLSEGFSEELRLFSLVDLPLVYLDSVCGDTGEIADVTTVDDVEVVQIVDDLEPFDDFVVKAVTRNPCVVLWTEPFPPNTVCSDCGGSLTVDYVVEESLVFPFSLVHVCGPVDLFWCGI